LPNNGLGRPSGIFLAWISSPQFKLLAILERFYGTKAARKN
jgi:hypothetical protein